MANLARIQPAHTGAAMPRLLARRDVARAWPRTLSPRVASVLQQCDSIFLATADAEGQPYIQHRGGPPGFIRLLDERTLAFADYAGNQQYTTIDNLDENARAFLFLMDYARGQRFKFIGRARVSDDAALIATLAPPADYPAEAERAILFEVVAWSANCSQHIPRLVPERA